jgi:hypothetical protein
MSAEPRGILADLEASDEQIAEEMGLAVRGALIAHQKAGAPIAVWDWDRDCLKIIPAEEIVIPEAERHSDDPARPTATP